MAAAAAETAAAAAETTMAEMAEARMALLPLVPRWARRLVLVLVPSRQRSERGK